MSDAKHTPGPWIIGVYDGDGSPVITYQARDVCRVENHYDDGTGNARLIAAAPDRQDQLRALLVHGWTVEKRSLYDEEGIEGWAWVELDGTEHVETGDWDELPSWPDTARAAIAKAKTGERIER